MGAQESLVGKVGRVTVSIPADGPGEVLLISGSKRRNEATQFRIVTGHGSPVPAARVQAHPAARAVVEAG